MLKFFNIENFTKVATLGASGLFVLIFDLWVMHIKIFVLPWGIF